MVTLTTQRIALRLSGSVSRLFEGENIGHSGSLALFWDGTY